MDFSYFQVGIRGVFNVQKNEGKWDQAWKGLLSFNVTFEIAFKKQGLL